MKKEDKFAILTVVFVVISISCLYSYVNTITDLVLNLLAFFCAFIAGMIYTTAFFMKYKQRIFNI